MLKRTLILALAAMAVAAVTAPIASAEWIKHHDPIQANETVNFTGGAAFTSAVIGGITCETDANVEFIAKQTTALVKQFEVDTTQGGTPTTKCTTYGPLIPCTVKSVESKNLPWTVHSDGADTITITTGEIVNVLENHQNGACGVVQQINLKPGTVHAQVTSGETCTVKHVILGGQLETQTGAKVQIHDTQSVTPSTTYGTSEGACPA